MRESKAAVECYQGKSGGQASSPGCDGGEPRLRSQTGFESWLHHLLAADLGQVTSLCAPQYLADMDAD